jgi:hypothetical protein
MGNTKSIANPERRAGMDGGMQALGVDLLQLPKDIEERGRKGGAQKLAKGRSIAEA